MICSTGGFLTTCHNEVHDITAQLLTEMYSIVSVEPPLQPLSGEACTHRSANVEDFARADLNALGFLVLTTGCLF